MALLLKIVTHDLLSPLTAAKWYAELLASKGVKGEKVTQYVSGIRESTVLAITITKRVQIASHVLSGGYTAEPSACFLHELVARAGSDLVPQFQRHGLTLSVEAAPTKTTALLDQELVALLVWGGAKYVLALAPAGASVHLSGSAIPPNDTSYTIELTAEDIDNAEKAAQKVLHQTFEGSHDQAAVFSELIARIAPLLHVEINSFAEGRRLVIRLMFDLGSVHPA